VATYSDFKKVFPNKKILKEIKYEKDRNEI